MTVKLQIYLDRIFGKGFYESANLYNDNLFDDIYSENFSEKLAEHFPHSFQIILLAMISYFTEQQNSICKDQLR